jgi:hypothetical protein
MLFALSECGIGWLAISKQFEIDLESDGAEAVLAAPCTTLHSKSTWQHQNPGALPAFHVIDQKKQAPVMVLRLFAPGRTFQGHLVARP